MIRTSASSFSLEQALTAMFGVSQSSTDEDASPDLSILGEGSTAQGSFDLKTNDLRVDGVIDGDVRTEGHVYVAQGGAVQGEIQAGSIRVGGRAEGVLCARQSLVLIESATVRGILCAEELTIEDGADFEGGICDTAERISALKTVFSSTEVFTIPGLSSSRDKTAIDQPSQPSDTTDQSVILDIEHPSPSKEESLFPPTQEGDALPETPSSSASPSPEQAVVKRDTEEAGDAETFSKLEW